MNITTVYGLSGLLVLSAILVATLCGAFGYSGNEIALRDVAGYQVGSMPAPNWEVFIVSFVVWFLCGVVVSATEGAINARHK